LQTKLFSTAEGAIAAWNTRVTDPALAAAQAEVTRLTAELADKQETIRVFTRTIVRAEAAWKAQHQDSEFYPDVPDLLVWLKEQVDALKERRCETCKHYDGAEHLSICWTHDSYVEPDDFCDKHETKEAPDA